MPKKLTSDQVNIQFKTSESGLCITIETPRLIIRSVKNEDLDHYYDLFIDPQVMNKYASGKSQTDRSRIELRIQGWVHRWGNNDPFNGMAVFGKSLGEFMGHVIVGRSDEGFGVGEFAGLGNKQFWSQGYGSEATSAIMHHLVPQILKKEYRLDGFPLKEIVATTRVDHSFVQRILEWIGFETDKAKVNEKFGAQRYLYRIKTSLLLTEYQSSRQFYTSSFFTTEVCGHPNETEEWDSIRYASSEQPDSKPAMENCHRFTK